MGATINADTNADDAKATCVISTAATIESHGALGRRPKWLYVSPMLVETLEALLADDDAVRAVAVFDDLGSLVASAASDAFDESAFSVVVRAWLAARTAAAAWTELRLEGPQRAFVVRAVGPALFAAEVDPAAPLGRVAMRMRLLHNPILGALP